MHLPIQISEIDINKIENAKQPNESTNLCAFDQTIEHAMNQSSPDLEQLDDVSNKSVNHLFEDTSNSAGSRDSINHDTRTSVKKCSNAIDLENEYVSNNRSNNNSNVLRADDSSSDDELIHLKMGNKLLSIGQTNNRPNDYLSGGQIFTHTMPNIVPKMMNKGDAFDQFTNVPNMTAHQMNHEFAYQFDHFNDSVSHFFANTQYNEFNQPIHLASMMRSNKEHNPPIYEIHSKPVDHKIFCRSHQPFSLKETCSNFYNVFNPPAFISQQSLINHQINQKISHQSNTVVSNFYANEHANIASVDPLINSLDQSGHSISNSHNPIVCSNGKTDQMFRDDSKQEKLSDCSRNHSLDESVKYQGKKRQILSINRIAKVNAQVNLSSDRRPPNNLMSCDSTNQLSVDTSMGRGLNKVQNHTPESVVRTNSLKKKRLKLNEPNSSASKPERMRIKTRSKNLSNEILEKKRNLANTQERERMLRLNQALDLLRQIMQSLTSSPKKLSKIMTLKLAIAYIKKLRSLLGE